MIVRRINCVTALAGCAGRWITPADPRALLHRARTIRLFDYRSTPVDPRVRGPADDAGAHHRRSRLTFTPQPPGRGHDPWLDADYSCTTRDGP